MRVVRRLRRQNGRPQKPPGYPHRGSIGVGEDGPTHQPFKLATLYRSILGPYDSEGTAGEFIAALEAKDTPSILSLSRHGLEQYPQYFNHEGALRSAYVFIEEEDADVRLMGVRAEMVFAVKTREMLRRDYGIKARVVSFPCQRIFENQPLGYKRQVLQYCSRAPRVVVEAYAVSGWERYAGTGYFMGSFGKSLPGNATYPYFGFIEEAIAPRVEDLVKEAGSGDVECLRGEFRNLNAGRRK